MGLIGAFVGALAVVLSQFVSARATLRLDRERQLRTDVATATRSLLVALQAQQWFLWNVIHDSDFRIDTEVRKYESSISPALASISGDLGVLSALWPDAYERYEPLAAEIFMFDEAIAECVLTFGSARPEATERFKRIAVRVLPYHWYVFRQVARVVAGNGVERYEPAKWARTAARTDQ